jgi:hypothetical protein
LKTKEGLRFIYKVSSSNSQEKMLHYLPPELLDSVLAHTTFASKIALACKQLNKAQERRTRQMLVNTAKAITTWSVKWNGPLAFTLSSSALRFRHSLAVERSPFGITCTKCVQKCRFSSLEYVNLWTFTPETELDGQVFMMKGRRVITEKYTTGIANFIAANAV